jgi:hypothetical protein
MRCSFLLSFGARKGIFYFMTLQLIPTRFVRLHLSRIPFCLAFIQAMCFRWGEQDVYIARLTWHQPSRSSGEAEMVSLRAISVDCRGVGNIIIQQLVSKLAHLDIDGWHLMVDCVRAMGRGDMVPGTPYAFHY